MRKRIPRGRKTANDSSTEAATEVKDEGIEIDVKVDDTTVIDNTKIPNVVDSSTLAANLFVKLGFSPDGTCDDLTKLDCDQMMVHIEGT